MNHGEQLREALLDLERSRDREQRLRKQADDLLDGLQLLIETDSSTSMFRRLLGVLKDSLGFEHACILLCDERGGLTPVAATSSLLRKSNWQAGDHFRRVLAGRASASFSVKLVPEWRGHSPKLLARVTSALHAPLRATSTQAMLICTHSERGYFTQEHLRTVERFGPLASQVLMKIEIKELMARQHELETEKASIEERSHLLQQMHDEALSVSRAKSGFLAAMSHEIRTPMNAILGILELLGDSELNEQQRTLVRTGQSSSELLLSIINGVLDFSKMEADHLELEQKSFRLGELIRQCFGLMENQARQKGLEFRLELASDLPTMATGDASRLRQILINLIGNAIKFTSEGSVELRAWSIPSGQGQLALYCEVRDTGIGIPDEFQARMFEQFTMMDPSYGRRQEGTGLGLAICRRLVNLMNGAISVTSTEGVGSSFRFHVMLAQPRPEQQRELERDRRPAERSVDGIRLLMVEDNPANQMVNRAILEYAGLRVDVAGSGEEAIEAVRRAEPGHYRVVLMDVSMPGMDGLQATRAIRELPEPRSTIPVVALTAHALTGDRERFLEAGMNDYLTKPMNRDEVLRCIARWAGSPVAEAASGPVRGMNDATSTDGERVDRKVVQELASNLSPDVIPGLVAHYIDDARQRVTRIVAAADAMDDVTIKFECHALGSAAAAYGNQRLHLLARQIERLCHDGQCIKAVSGVEALAREAESSLTGLERFVTERFG